MPRLIVFLGVLTVMAQWTGAATADILGHLDGAVPCRLGPQAPQGMAMIWDRLKTWRTSPRKQLKCGTVDLSSRTHSSPQNYT